MTPSPERAGHGVRDNQQKASPTGRRRHERGADGAGAPDAPALASPAHRGRVDEVDGARAQGLGLASAVARLVFRNFTKFHEISPLKSEISATLFTLSDLQIVKFSFAI